MKRLFYILLAVMCLSVVDASALSRQVADGLRGDVNADGIVNVNDVVQLVNQLVGLASAGFDPVAADLDKDGLLTVTDVIILVNIIVSNPQPDDDTPPADDDQANPEFPVLAPPNPFES